MTARTIVFKLLGGGINLISLFSPRAGGAIAFNIFASPPKPKIREKEVAFLNTANRLDFDFEGKRIAVYRWSNGTESEASDKVNQQPYVLLAYGWGYNAGRWRYLVPQLLKVGLAVIAYDPFGHGYSDAGKMEYPTMVRMQTAIIHRFGRATHFVGHSFGGGGMMGTVGNLPTELWPRSICLMGVFSDARWIFHNFRNALGLSERSYLAMTRRVYQLTGHRLSSFDNARVAAKLHDILGLIIHDPEDKITSFSNAQRIHNYWPGSALFSAKNAGHHLGNAAITDIVVDWLTNETAPTPVSISDGLSQAYHELHTFFIPLEQDVLHGEIRSGYYG